MSAVGKTLTTCYPAVAASVPEARRVISELAAEAGAPPERVDAVRLAASEAITNAVRHAYRRGGGMVHLTAAVVSGELWILVADDGCGMQVRSDSPGLGLGLGLISQECDDLTILTRASGGTEVRMRFNLVGAEVRAADQGRGSEASAARPASSRFSTTK